MTSKQFLGQTPNIKIFDFYTYLAEADGPNQNMLQRRYTQWFFKDSHPNKLANQTIAPKFIDCITRSASKCLNITQ